MLAVPFPYFGPKLSIQVMFIDADSNHDGCYEI